MGSARERRREARVRPQRSARLIDISSGGATFETSARLARDGMVDLLLRLDDHVMPVSARVLRVRRAGGSVRASVAFERILESDRTLLQQALVREVAERMTLVLRSA